MGFIETSYGGKPNLSDVNIDSILNMGNYGITASGNLNILNTMDLNNNDLIGVKRFICQDYLSALLTAASDVEQEIVILDDLTGVSNITYYTNKKFRIPSNFISGSVIRVKYYARSTISEAKTNGIYQYDPETETKTTLTTHSTPGNTSEWVSEDITANAGDIFGFWCKGIGSRLNAGSSGVKMCYDSFVQSGAVWEVIDE